MPFIWEIKYRERRGEREKERAAKLVNCQLSVQASGNNSGLFVSSFGKMRTWLFICNGWVTFLKFPKTRITTCHYTEHNGHATCVDRSFRAQSGGNSLILQRVATCQWFFFLMQVTSKALSESWRLTRQGMWDSFILSYDHRIPISIPAFAIRLLVSGVFFPTGNKISAPPQKKGCVKNL